VKDSRADSLLQVNHGLVDIANERQRQLATDHTRHGLCPIFNNTSIVSPHKEHRCYTHSPAIGSFPPSLPSRTARFATYADERNVGCVYHWGSSIKRQTIYIGFVEVVTDPFFLEGVLYIKLTSHVSISVFSRIIFA